jgi:hypothetical protein
MTPQDRDLIESVFTRLAQTAGAPKDSEAQALIAERIRAMPDASYGLVQAVLVQEDYLKQAQARITELEQRLAASSSPSQGGFLNTANNPWVSSSPRPQQQQQQQQAYQQPGFQQPVPQASPWGGQPNGGGFLRQAATAAAGVAGGILVAEGISSLFSGNHGGMGGGFGGGFDPASSHSAGQPQVVENIVENNYYGNSAPDPVQTADYTTDADTSSGGGDDWI